MTFHIAGIKWRAFPGSKSVRNVVKGRVQTYLLEFRLWIGMQELQRVLLPQRKDLSFSLKCSVDSIRMQEEDYEKPAAISGWEGCTLLQARKSWDSVFYIADRLIQKDLASEACRVFRDHVQFCLFGLIVMLVAHYLFLGSLELKGSGVEKSLCVVMVGLSLVLRIMGVGLVVCLCTRGFSGLIWKHRRTCSCFQDVEQSRTRAQKAQWPSRFITDAPHHRRDCSSACIIQHDLHILSQIETRSHKDRTVESEGFFMPQDFSSPKRVLLVEDIEINRIILRKVLQTLNLHCEEAENGKVAVDYFKQGRIYDLVFMDKEMPVMDGHEATRQLRSMGVKTPIVALTANALQSDKDLFFEAGVDDFQTKPLPRDKLVKLLARYGVKNCAGNRGG